jgi:hypothetical protein
MQSIYDCQLTLVLPVELEDEMIDLLRSLPNVVSGYSLMNAEGFGATAELNSMPAANRAIRRCAGRAVFIIAPGWA